MPTSNAAPADAPRRWYRSLYWRIALGFIAFLAVMLLAQGALFLWLSSQRDEVMPPRLLADLARIVAEELSDAAASEPGADVADLARTRFAELGRPAALVLADGRVVAAGLDLDPAAVAMIHERFRETNGANRSRRGPRPWRFRGQLPAARGGIAAPRLGQPWAAAPMVVQGQVTAAVVVGRRPPGAVARELVPWLAAGLATLLAVGTALAALAVFRPAQRRLHDLEEAARRFGAGDLTARAPETGGDEVASVARAFNRMAGEAAAREAALVDADRTRRQLLADVTHELRTPLTAIRGYAETLTLPGFAPQSAQGRHAVQVVDAEALRLQQLVDDLLDLARLDAGGAPLAIADVPVAALFARVVERHRPAALAAGIALETSVAPEAALVRGDARRLEQVLQNLTANALRYTPWGGRVSLSTERAGDALVLSVRDTGAGIAREHLPFVFDRFYKADPARSDQGGTGLGLSIARAIVERHGGTMTVTSTPHVETRFDMRFPA